MVAPNVAGAARTGEDPDVRESRGFEGGVSEVAGPATASVRGAG